VIVLLHGAPAFGAVEHYVREIVEGLRDRGHEALLLYPEVPATAAFASLSGGSVRSEPFPTGLLASSAAQLLHLQARLRRERPQVVHVTDVWPQALVAARLARVPRLLVTHHTPELPREDNLVGRAWQRLGWATRPEVIYTSETDRRNDGRSLRSHVVYYGIDLARFARAPEAHEGRVVGNVARLAEQKGQCHLVEAAPAVLERHPDTRFVIVGGGGLRADLERAVVERGLADRFEFTGDVADVPAQLARMDVFALPSLYEGLCYAVIEAQAAGVPVVATPVGGVPENVVPGETGVLVPPGDVQALGAAIVSLLDDPAEASRLADAARRRVRERYALPRMVAETIELYGLRA
jgi:glycosyltransferase involved in cell wall biosynthesis